MKRAGVIVAVIAGLALVLYGSLHWAYGDFANGVIEDAKNHPMHHGIDTVVIRGDAPELTEVGEDEAAAVADREMALGHDTCRYVLNVPPDIDMPEAPAFDTTIVRSVGCKKHMLFFPAWGTGTSYEITNEAISQMVYFRIEVKEKQWLDITELPEGDYGIHLLACGNGGFFTLRIKGRIR
jgi:hypothetical protein